MSNCARDTTYAALLVFLITCLTACSAQTYQSSTNGTVNISGLSEASGIAASRNNPGVLWTENDSGNPAVVYAINSQGKLLGTYQLPGNTDNEDIGIGPGPVTNVSYLYVADIGDNNENRSSISLYQIPEPAVYAWQTNMPFINRAMKGTRTITLKFPTNDTPHNAESEFIDPVTGDWFLLTKASTTARIYTVPAALLNSSLNVTMTFAGTFSFDVASAADISPLGNEIIVRQEEFARLYARTNGQSITNALKGAFTAITVTGTAKGEPNGEAVGFDYYGGGYFTVSESSGSQPLRYFKRTSYDGATPPRVLVPAASNWKFLADGSNQGTAWRASQFNDATWSNGPAQLGYGDGDEQTVVSYGPTATNKFITTYFRKSFAVTNANRIASLTAKIVAADGALIYLNGFPIFNLNLTNDAPYTGTATPMPLALGDTWHSFAADPRLLAEGTNVIAAEVHLASATSTNLSCDLQLIAVEGPHISSIQVTNHQPRLLLVGSSNSPTVVEVSSNFVTWTNLSTVILTNGTGSIIDTQATNDLRFYRANRSIP